MSAKNLKVLAKTQLKLPVSKSGTDKSTVFLSLNRDWTSIIKKIPASLNGFQLQFKKDSYINSNEIKQKIKSLTDDIRELPTMLNDIKFSQKNDAVQDEKMKWRVKKNTVSDLSIHARTKYILSSISNAQSESSKLQRLESLVEHFIQYPEGIRAAAKQGAVLKLITVRDNSGSERVAEVVREALAILGYVDPLPKKGIRILAIDGGGVRGLLVMQMLEKLEELTGRRVHELFDYICGVSTGSVIACTIGASGKSIKDIMDLYMDLSTKIFKQNAFFGAKSLIWNHGYYDTELWESMLKEHVGEEQLIKTVRKKGCPKIGIISAVPHVDSISAFIFRNYEFPYKIKSLYPGSFKHQLWEAARASAAAPTYFPEFQLGEYIHQDGGILFNNPTAVAIHESKKIWPDKPLQCVVSFGTGRENQKIGNLKKDKNFIPKQTSWKEKFTNILISATDTEAVHVTMNDLIGPSVYFRFNPYLTNMVSMDEREPEKLAALQNDTLMYMRKNEEKFQEAANALVSEKSTSQKIVEWAGGKAAKYSDMMSSIIRKE